MTKRHLEVRNGLVLLCQTYCQVIDEMLEQPHEYGLDIGTEDEALKNILIKFGEIQSRIKDDKYDPSDICVELAETVRSFNVLIALRPRSSNLDEFIKENRTVSQTYNATYNLYNLNSMSHYLIKIEEKPEKYLLNLSIDEVRELHKEIELLIHLQDKGIYDEVEMSAKVAEITYVFLFEIVGMIDTMMEVYSNAIPRE